MRLTEKIQAISEGSKSDDYGGSIPVDTVDFEAWASIEQLRTSKDIEQAQISLPSTFRVRTRKEFDKKQIVKWRGKKYSILSTPQVDFVRRSRFYTFNMTEAVL
jgi:SPP1 family predicted phage head-tail adaptor